MGKHAHHRARRAPTCLEPAFTSKEALPGLGTLVLGAFFFFLILLVRISVMVINLAIAALERSCLKLSGFFLRRW